ncbi:MAG: hypothetical protein ABIJ21_00490 [Nanoarchaeota archaeon]
MDKYKNCPSILSFMVDVKISYETLFDILRREKQREDLQDLPASFVKDVISYLSDKEAILRKHFEINDPFSPREQENAKIQLKNVRKILRELFERRENKIIRLAQDKVRQGPQLSLRLLDEEKEFFQELIKALTDQRVRLLNPLLLSQPIIRVPEPAQQRAKAEIPLTPPGDSYTAKIEKESILLPEEITGKKAAQATQKPSPKEKELKEPGRPAQQGKPEAKQVRNETKHGELESKNGGTEKQIIQSSEKRIRILNPLPRFVGPELEVYGPYAESSVTSLPLSIADLLIRKGRAEEVKE